MNKSERDEARELLQLEAKLIQVRIKASYLKQRKSKLQDSGVSNGLMTLLDLGGELKRTGFLYKTAGLAIPRRYRFGALLFAFVMKALMK
ncbi:hypothetical protein [Neisseria sicca]|uniref:hypothetical protein n=1 Tax=Neisseria sicca TaxID=490 RepID=UPI00195CEFD7|nr:hypothetical protein [Neisseria sicca]VTX49072.1 Uncharacterised protein [Neisseria sicca]